ncbi:MAG TPA: CDP-alcohol phosphatidyltransferase family protein [Vicinamibacterales bacterium]|nr:CDP-alcohol phosphatidyltransferase family protein [Vicinamibacterales bacterium]
MQQTRENDGVLAAAERRALIWMAARLPAAINSDHLTALGVAGMVLASAAFAAGGTWPAALLLVIAGLVINWFGDSLDGTLARVRNCQRPRYGYYLDHVLDTAGTLVLFAGIAAGGFMTPIVALATLVAYYLVSIEVYLATHALGRFRMSFWGLGPTELRILLAIGALVVSVRPEVSVFGTRALLFDVGGVIGSVGLVATAAISAVTHARALYREEPLPDGDSHTFHSVPRKV